MTQHSPSDNPVSADQAQAARGTSAMHQRVEDALLSRDLASSFAVADIESAEQMVSSALASVDPAIRIVSFGERPRGQVRELVVEWQLPEEDVYETIIPIHPNHV